MSKYEKIIQNLKNNPKNISFETIKSLLEKFGYRAYNNGSSHWQFRKKNKPTITIPYKRPIKAIYVKMVLKLLEL